jgi:hypothetical protein
MKTRWKLSKKKASVVPYLILFIISIAGIYAVKKYNEELMSAFGFIMLSAWIIVSTIHARLWKSYQSEEESEAQDETKN